MRSLPPFLFSFHYRIVFVSLFFRFSLNSRNLRLLFYTLNSENCEEFISTVIDTGHFYSTLICMNCFIGKYDNNKFETRQLVLSTLVPSKGTACVFIRIDILSVKRGKPQLSPNGLRKFQNRGAESREHRRAEEEI